MKKPVVTYFEPFDGRKVNASKEVVLALGDEFEKVSIPVSWKRSVQIINEIVDRGPRYLFMVGEAGDYSDVTVELVARNICHGVDEDGDKKDKERILRATPKTINTNFKVPSDIPFTNSDNAGRFLCNYVYYISLLRTELTKIIFIHVPFLHSKGSRKKEVLVNKIKEIINYFISKDESLLIRHKNKILNVDKSNAYYLYPELQREYQFPNILIGINRKDDGSFSMSGRCDGYQGILYEYGKSQSEEREAIKRIYFQLLKYQDSLDEEDRNDLNHIELTRRFKFDEYVGSEKIVKRYINLFISRANYSNEYDFYQSLDYIYEHNLKSVLSLEEEKALYEAREYVSRLGLEKSTQLLFRLVGR